jgi:hypothetical protein
MLSRIRRPGETREGTDLVAINSKHSRILLQQFNFRQLFAEELCWASPAARPYQCNIDGQTFTATPIAEQGGMMVFEIQEPKEGLIPTRDIQLKITRHLAKTYAEHIIIFVNTARSSSLWLWVKREDGRYQPRDHRYSRSQSGDSLLQKLVGIAFTYEELDEEGRATIGVVLDRVRAALDTEKVTKRFYQEFAEEHAAFLKRIEGMDKTDDRKWYASLMLNRLMFIYFIQKKGFLDGDHDYLRNKLKQVKDARGKDEFLTFYRHFLLRLFHHGLGKPHKGDRQLEHLIGNVPYLNGGIFAVHELEDPKGRNPSIDIPDVAFEKVFALFDRYQWHLDERPLRNDWEINPDVLGYIFERYINDRAAMGAYYTKEDITGYIGRTCIIPCLFDRVAELCRTAFDGPAALWKLLPLEPDRYIQDPVKHGLDTELPDEIRAGLKDETKRATWSKQGTPDVALTTETWREVVARREYCQKLRKRLASGKITDINELVTLNVDLEKFAEDVIGESEPDLLSAFYTTLKNMTVLDPTCGSGAFHFAAVNILGRLYTACISRMEMFGREWERTGEKGHARYRKAFAEELDEIGKHQNPRYFILKTIILNNLFGVDIMEEAVEICKLRLFLKLVAQVDPDPSKDNMGIEPLPDIDFNIRTGNTLVGFASREKAKAQIDRDKNGQAKLQFTDALQEIDDKCRLLEKMLERWRKLQENGKNTAEEKRAYQDGLSELRVDLDRYLAHEYGRDTSKTAAHQKWLANYQPFHWFVEFHTIMTAGGFDVIIGNPPYISKAKVRKVYQLLKYDTENCSDIYANVLERVSTLLKPTGRTGMIVPLSLSFSGDFASLRTLIFKHYRANWFSFFARIPAALFSADVRVRNTIHIGAAGDGDRQQHSTVLHRWFETARPHLFGNLRYAPFNPAPYKGLIPKIGSPALSVAFENCFATTEKTVASFFSPRKTDHVLHFKKSAYNWLNFCRHLPPCYDENGRQIAHTKFGEVYFRDQETRDLAFLLLNGKIMFSFWGMIGDDFDVTQWMFADFPVDFEALPARNRKHLLAFADQLDELMQENVSYKLNAGKKVGNYNLALCRSLTDRIDALFIEALPMSMAREDIELMYSQIVKTDFSSEPEEE